MRCGRGSACSCTRASRSRCPRSSAATAAKLAAFATVAAGAVGCVPRVSSPTASAVRRSRSSRWRCPAAARRRSACCSAAALAPRRRVPRLGHQHRRRFRAVLGVDRRARRPLARRDDAHAADGDGFHADAGHDPPDPVLGRQLGWRYAFVPLAIGPAIGVYAMARLRAHPRVGAAGRRAR